MKKPVVRPHSRFIIRLLGILVLCVISLGGFNYVQAKQLFDEGRTLINAGKGSEALEVLAKADSRWSTPGLKAAIAFGIGDANTLIKEQQNYDLGVKYYESKDWSLAAEYLSRIGITSRYYEDAINKLKLMNQTMDEQIAKHTQELQQIRKTISTTPTAPPMPKTTPNTIFVPVAIETKAQQAPICQMYPTGDYYSWTYIPTPYWKYRCKDPDAMIVAWLSNIEYWVSDKTTEEMKNNLLQSCSTSTPQAHKSPCIND